MAIMVQAIKAGCQEAETAQATHLITDPFKLPERVNPLSGKWMCFGARQVAGFFWESS